MRFVHPQKAGKRNDFHPVSRSRWEVITSGPVQARAIAAVGRWRGDYGLSPFTVIYSFIPHPLSFLLPPPLPLRRRRRLLCSPIITWKSQDGDGGVGLNWGRTTGEWRVDHRAIKDPHNSCHSAHRIGTVHMMNAFNTRPRLRESERAYVNGIKFTQLFVEDL